jgi:hypothetical protein
MVLINSALFAEKASAIIAMSIHLSGTQSLANQSVKIADMKYLLKERMMHSIKFKALEREK